ncbi:MAG: spore coat CotO family protein [Bacillaceae bacterium]|nr:spore coat CotO family protein [Bacillaceae bacterium]
MKEKKQASTNPVLYIPQPKLQYSSPKMQTNYFSQKKPVPKEVVDSVQKENNVIQKLKGTTALEQQEEKKGKKVKAKKMTSKPLKEMSIDEKITYLTNLPKYIPHIPCLIVLENENIIGFIKEQLNNSILVDLAKEKTLKVIDIELIKEIHLYVSK